MYAIKNANDRRTIQCSKLRDVFSDVPFLLIGFVLRPVVKMANYYHEARAHVRRLKELADDSKRRAERRAEHAGSQVVLKTSAVSRLCDENMSLG